MLNQDQRRRSKPGIRPAESAAVRSAVYSKSFDLSNIPEAMKALPQWVLWKGEDKAPYDVFGRFAKSNDPNTWNDLSTVAAAAGESDDGIGFMFDNSGQYAGIDLDGCRDPVTGRLHPEAADIVAAFNSYTEISCSGTGLHIYVKARIPDGYESGKKCEIAAWSTKGKPGGIEVYDRKRYFTVTGNALPGSSVDVESRSLDSLMAKYWPKTNGKGRGDQDRIDKTSDHGYPVDPIEVARQEMDTLMAIPKFAETWGKLREAEFHSDASRYSQALANCTVKAELSCGHWVELELRWRAHHDADHQDKPLRADYQRRTWEKALNQLEKEPDWMPGQGAESADMEWPDPVPLNTGLPPVIEFDYGLLPDGISPWVKDITERQQCPPDFVAVTAMVGLASLIGRKVAIHPKQQDDWLVVPNLWGALIGRSSTMKSPALNDGLKPLKRLAADAHKQYKDDLELFEVSKMTNKAIKEANERDIAAAVKSKDQRKIRDAEAAAMNDRRNQTPQPAEQRYIVNDATVEKLGELLNENPDGLLLERDELTGWLKSLDREDRANDRAFYLEAFNGLNRYTYDRIGRGTIHIESTTVSMIGGIQPARLRPYVWHTINQGTGDDGLIQRFQLAVYPNTKAEYVNADQYPDKEAKEAAWSVFQRLAELEAQTDDDGRPFGVRFDADGQAVFNQWRTELEEKVRQPDIHPAIESHLTKYRSLMPSLALIIHIIDCDHMGPVGRDAAVKAAAWCEYLESHAYRIYGAAANPAVSSAAIILNRRDKLPDPFTARCVQRKGWAGLSESGNVKAAITELAESGYVCAVKQGPGPSGGAPKTFYKWNPKT